MLKALFGAGCFWGVEEHFRNIPGVIDTKVGYSGGHESNPNYENVCEGHTGHAEVVLIKYNEKGISYEKLLNSFWTCHDPTQINRQGLDIGHQYRSVIYYYSTDQKIKAINSKIQFGKNINKEIATTIEKAKNFYLAENYHQCFLQKRKKISFY